MISSLRRLFASSRPFSRRPRHSVRPMLEEFEPRIVPVVPTLTWSPQADHNASNVDNWLFNGARGQSPLTLPSSTIILGNNQPITWDVPAGLQKETYVLGTLNMNNGYNAAQTVPIGVTVSVTGPTNGSGSTLSLKMAGPSQDSNQGSSWFTSGVVTINNLIVQGTGGGRSGNFVVGQGSVLMLGQGAQRTNSLENSEIDVVGQLTISPDGNGNFSPLVMSQSSLLTAATSNGVNGSIITKDGSESENLILADGTSNQILICPGCQLYCYDYAADTIEVPIMNHGMFTVLGIGSGTSLEIEGVNTTGPAYSVDSIALNNYANSGYVYLWDTVTLFCDHGFYLGGANTSYTAILQADTNSNTISDLAGSASGIYFDEYSSIIFGENPSRFGTLYLNGNVVFLGNYQPVINDTKGSLPLCDQLYVRGNLTFGASAYINVVSYGNGTFFGPWQVFVCTGAIGNWSIVGCSLGYKLGNPGYIIPA